MSDDLAVVIRQAHAIMDFGTITQCATHIPTGKCSCCTFDKSLGNWIGLLPGEDEYLRAGDVSHWQFESRFGDAVDSVACERGGTSCSNKPLDCKMYPFFPADVAVEEQGLVVRFVAGFPKCPLRDDRGFQDSLVAADSHLGRCTQVAILMHEAGLTDWIRRTAENFKGYREVYTVLSGPEDASHYALLSRVAADQN